jgi:hypothetical protein
MEQLFRATATAGGMTLTRRKQSTRINSSDPGDQFVYIFSSSSKHTIAFLTTVFENRTHIHAKIVTMFRTMQQY